MLGADIVDRSSKLRFAGLDTEIHLRLPDHIAGFVLEQRHFVFTALLPVFVQPIQVIGQPSRADLQKGEFQFRETDRQTLANHAGKLKEYPNRKGVGVNFRKSCQPGCAELARCIAGAMNAEDRAELFSLGKDRIVESVSERQWQTCRQHLKSLQGPALLLHGLNSAAAAAGERIGKQPTQDRRFERSLYSFAKLRVARSCYGDLVRHFLIFGDVAGAGGKADRLSRYRARP